MTQLSSISTSLSISAAAMPGWGWGARSPSASRECFAPELTLYVSVARAGLRAGPNLREVGKGMNVPGSGEPATGSHC